MFFKSKSKEEQQQSLASFLPNGRVFLAKALPTTNLYKLLYGLAVEIARVEGVINDIASEHDIRTTTLLIEEWERALGIPDDCFPGTGDLATRRNHVLIKLASLGVQTEQDFIDLATIFGFTITIEKMAEFTIFPMYSMFPIEFSPDPMTSRFTWRIRFTSGTPRCIFPFVSLFPVCFGDNASNIVECLFDKLRPANTIIEYRYPL